MSSPLQLKDRVAIVTGGSKGIGRAIALGFAQQGASVSLCARDAARAESVASEIRDRGGRAIATACDVSAQLDVSRLVARTLEEYGRIDILVANAGVTAPVKPLIEMTVDEWKHHLDINLTGVFLCNQAVLPHMIRQNYGRIQNLGSGIESDPMAAMAAYAASKAAVSAMTRVLATETAAYDIKVNVHYPGDLRTGLNPQAEGRPEDAVPCAVFLASLPGDGPTGRTFELGREVVPGRTQAAWPGEVLPAAVRSLGRLRSGIRALAARRRSSR